MLITARARSTTDGSGPMRSAFAQSTATSVRSPTSAGNSRARSSRRMNAYSRGTGAAPSRNMTTSLPSPRSATVVARSDPSASPSGFSCVVTMKRSPARSASAIAARSLIVWDELIDQLCHAHAALDRRIVFERHVRGSFHSELACEASLQHPVRGLEPLQRRLLLAQRAEHADVDSRLAKIGRCFDTRDRHETDPRVLQLGQRLREDLPHRLVHTPHPLAHGSHSSLWLLREVRYC